MWGLNRDFSQKSNSYKSTTCIGWWTPRQYINNFSSTWTKALLVVNLCTTYLYPFCSSLKDHPIPTLRVPCMLWIFDIYTLAAKRLVKTRYINPWFWFFFFRIFETMSEKSATNNSSMEVSMTGVQGGSKCFDDDGRIKRTGMIYENMYKL